MVGVGQIGFVSCIWVGAGAVGGGNWVRFVFLVFHRSAAAEIGFVSHFLWVRAGGLVEIGFVSRNWGWRDTWYAGIGFVSWKRWRCDAGGRINWVRFVKNSR